VKGFVASNHTALGVDPGAVSGFCLRVGGAVRALGCLHITGACSDVTDALRLLRSEPFACYTGPINIERPLRPRPFALHSIVTQSATYGTLRTILTIQFGTVPTDVSPADAKIALTGSGNAGSKGKKGLQKILMVAAARQFPGFNDAFGSLYQRGRFTIRQARLAEEACADALAISLVPLSK